MRRTGAWLLGGLLAASTWATTAEARPYHPQRDEIWRAVAEEGQVRVIMQLDTPTLKTRLAASNRFKTLRHGERPSRARLQAERALRKTVRRTVDRVLGPLPVNEYRVTRRYRNFPFVALELSATALAQLEGQHRVRAIWRDVPDPLPPSPEIVEAKDTCQESELPEEPPDHPQLRGTTEVTEGPISWARRYTGEGWYVAILDSGIRSTHEFFSGKTIIEACFATGETGPGDCPNGTNQMIGTGSAAHHPSSYYGFDHGTHVAGIAAGDNGSLHGVAHDADIIAIQVFSRFSASYPSCPGVPCILSYSSDQIAGLDHVYSLRNSYQIAAANMSLGGGRYYSACDGNSRKPSIDNLRSVGIATAISTGNNGYCDSIQAPACISTSVSVGAVTDDDLEAYFNNWHPDLMRVFAPGVSVYSSTGDSDSSYESWNGTSMAAPHVTGAWAVMKQSKPTATVSELLAAVETSGRTVVTGCGTGDSRPRVAVSAAIGTALTPHINVTAPRSVDLWLTGTLHTITWVVKGEQSGTVGIDLYHNGIYSETIVSATSNDGSYDWTVPTYLSADSTYTIQVETDDSLVTGTSQAFSINLAPTITVTAPASGQSWQKGSSYDILWTQTGIPYESVAIDLLQGGSWLRQITATTPNDGSYSWTVPGDLTAASNYAIRVQTEDLLGEGTSATFSIID